MYPNCHCYRDIFCVCLQTIRLSVLLHFTHTFCPTIPHGGAGRSVEPTPNALPRQSPRPSFHTRIPFARSVRPVDLWALGRELHDVSSLGRNVGYGISERGSERGCDELASARGPRPSAAPSMFTLFALATPRSAAGNGTHPLFIFKKILS